MGKPDDVFLFLDYEVILRKTTGIKGDNAKLIHLITTRCTDELSLCQLLTEDCVQRVEKRLRTDLTFAAIRNIVDPMLKFHVYIVIRCFQEKTK